MLLVLLQTANIVEAPHNARLGHPIAAGAFHHIFDVAPPPDERLQRLALRVPSGVPYDPCLGPCRGDVEVRDKSGMPASAAVRMCSQNIFVITRRSEIEI